VVHGADPGQLVAKARFEVVREVDDLPRAHDRHQRGGSHRPIRDEPGIVVLLDACHRGGRELRPDGACPAGR
jgi:hypothetical protein